MTTLQEELGDGPLTAPLWLVGARFQPGARLPFQWQAGTLLNQALAAAGLSRGSVRCEALVPRWSANDPTAERMGRDRLAALLSAHKPKVIVACGTEVAQWLVGDAWPAETAQTTRGYMWDTRFGRVLVSMDPEAIVTDWTPWRALLDFDVRRAHAEARAGAPPLAERRVHVVTHPLELGALYSAAARCALLSVDIENTQDLTLSCCGFAPTPEEAWVIPAIEGWQTDAIRTLCESGVPKVFQNGQYDRFFQKRFAGITVRNQVFDTQLAWHALNPELAGKKMQVGNRKTGSRRTVKSLRFLASIYTRDSFWKAYDFATEMDQFILNGKDCCITLDIARKQMAQLDAAGLRAVHDFEVALLDPCIGMTERGLRVNNERRLAMIENLDAQRGPLTDALCDFVVQRVLPLHMDKLGERVGLFRKRAVCKCCRNGKGKRDACWACAGFAKKPTKKQLAARSTLLQHTAPGVQVGEYVVVNVSPLKPCEKCGGAGEAFRTEFNPASPEQVKIVLYDLLKLPKRTKDGKLTTDEEALKSLLADAAPDAREFIVSLLRLGKLDTIRSIAVRIAPGPDGRIRTTYNPAGTETGRFSSSETFLIESTNLQNLPKREAVSADLDVKACIEADPGCVLIEADLSGAEAWVTAALCGDTDLLDKLRNGFKIHEWTAAFVLTNGLKRPTEVEDVTPAERQVFGKTPRHALNYGMQWNMFMRNVNAVADRTGRAINASEAKGTCAGYHALHPTLAQWWDRVLARIVTKGTITTCFGRTRTFYGRNRGERLGDAHREAIAYEPQSTIADLLNRGMLRWWRQHDGRVGELLAQVHDSVIVQTTEARGSMVAELVRRCLSEDITVNGITIRIPVDVKVLKNWAVHKAAQETT